MAALPGYMLEGSDVTKLVTTLLFYIRVGGETHHTLGNMPK